jgi:peptide/nickel transport system substrate-binding protein
MTKGSMKLNFTFDVGNFPTWVTAAQVIQQQLAQVGIKVKINTLDFASDLADLEKGDANLGLMGYTYADPDVLYLFLSSTQIGTGLNMGFVNNAKLDHLLNLGRETTNQAARKAVYVELQKYIDAQAIWAPIFTAQQFTVAQANIKGLEFTPLYGLMVQDVQ